MDVSRVRDRIALIAKRASSDDEQAHALEDDLYRDVLKVIAQTSSDPLARTLAAEAIKTAEIDFERWYA
ncbi:hypothetical protein ACH4GK_31775 [Streptomyces rimosus]|uniref:hypothetical protein n=1 Tax=Streptomyces rimosus TaxID=1927 RepID=UPI0004C598D1|nr:hypothetical protein [Streptomyces rimosus]